MDTDGKNRRRKEETHRAKMNGVGEDKHRSMNGKPEGKMSIEEVRERMQRLQQDVLSQVGDHLNSMVTEVVEGIENIANSGIVQNTAADKIYIDKKKVEQSGRLPEKHFETRNSVLTDLFNEVKHMKTVYNAWAAMLLILFLHTMAHDLIETGKTNFGFNTILSGFGKFPEVIQIWIAMTLSSFCVYAAHSFWAHQRIKFLPNSLRLKIWDYTSVTIFTLYQLMFLYLPAKAVIITKFPPPSAIVVLMEQVRMIMKIHAFVRSTVPVATSYKPHTEGKEFAFPGFSKFLYFMFAPTLIYRDSYPRTKKIRWRVVVWHFTEVLFIVFFIAFLTERFIFPNYKDYGLEPFQLRVFVLKTFNSTMPGITMYLCGFYCLLHAWMNAWAELMRFGDRMFYKDWWNSTSYDAYYRNWNVVVHDWLYTYIYKDLYEIVFPRSKYIATILVFTISAIVHEYILSVSFRLFYPIMLIIFGGPGHILVYITRKSSHVFGNLLLWFSLCLGSGIMVSFYAMEYFARVNCPGFEDEVLDLILPRSWVCRNAFVSSQLSSNH